MKKSLLVFVVAFGLSTALTFLPLAARAQYKKSLLLNVTTL
jgi:hypothetical protein